MIRLNQSLFAIVVSFALTGAVAQERWVDETNCPGGSGTFADPYCTIQDAICDLKDLGGTVRVRPGTYTEAIRIFPGVSVVSTDGPSVTGINAANEPCIMQDCMPSTTELTCAAVLMSAVMGDRFEPTDRLEGFTVSGGSGIIRDLEDGTEAQVGGGIFVFNGSPTITNNVINANQVAFADISIEFARGAGIYVQASELLANPVAQPVITNNEISVNSCNTPPGGDQYNFKFALGGGLYVGTWSAPTVQDNTFRNNQAGTYSTAYQLGGGGGVSLYTLSTAGYAPTLSRNLFEFNIAGDFGGGVYAGFSKDAAGIDRHSVGTVEDSIFQYNDAILGGGVATKYSTVTFRNNTFVQNDATYGAGLYVGYTFYNKDTTFANNIISYNYADTGAGGSGGGVYVYYSDPTVRFNAFYSNVPENVTGTKDGGIPVDDTDYIGIDGNVQADPQFVNRSVAGRDLSLQSTSPLIDAGENANASTTAYDGAPRIQDGDENGSDLVDMGAYEYPSDFDDDGTPDWQDPDDDNDGVDDTDDCDPENALVGYAATDQGTSLRVDYTPTDATLSWSGDRGSRIFNVYRGTFSAAASWVYDEVCFVAETPELTADDTATPAPDQGYYYLVSGKNICGESRAGVATSGDIFPGSACAPQNNDTDSDGVLDIDDNCPQDPNAGQEDGDLDFIGDACDICLNDPLNDLDNDGLCADVDGDDDGDGTNDVIDCAPNDPGATDTPGTVSGVRWSYDAGGTMRWDDQSSFGTDTAYDVAGGDVDNLSLLGGVFDAVCVEDDVTATSWIDTRGTPAPDAGFYYLVRAQNVCGDGGYGTGTGSSSRTPDPDCP